MVPPKPLEQGHTEAQYTLGQMCEDVGVNRRHPTGSTKPQNKRMVKAEYKLGEIYEGKR